MVLMVPLLIMATSLVSKINTSVALLKGWVNSFLAFMGQLYLGLYIKREIAQHDRLHPKQQSQKPPAPEPTIRFLDRVPDQPLSSLWPGRIPQGHLTLLDAAPGSGLSLMALTLAACISSGSPLPAGPPTQRGHVLPLAPYDSPTDILKARFQAAGGDPSHLQLVLPLVGDPSRDLAHTRPYAFPQDLDHLAAIIRSLDFCL